MQIPIWVTVGKSSIHRRWLASWLDIILLSHGQRTQGTYAAFVTSPLFIFHDHSRETVWRRYLTHNSLQFILNLWQSSSRIIWSTTMWCCWYTQHTNTILWSRTKINYTKWMSCLIVIEHNVTHQTGSHCLYMMSIFFCILRTIDARARSDCVISSRRCQIFSRRPMLIFLSRNLSPPPDTKRLLIIVQCTDHTPSNGSS